jgi:ParB-like chromosome segregation protein Spo0J
MAENKDSSWRDRLKVHPTADLFPMMSEAQLDELAADIAANGLQQHIVWLKDELIDARNRVAAIPMMHAANNSSRN